MQTDFDRQKSLQELEGEDWGEPTPASYLLTTCHHLRRKPLGDFTVEDLRIMIGQNIGLPFLVPMAIERLEENVFAEGNYYPGDLLKSVLTVEGSFWQQHPNLRKAVEELVQRASTKFQTLDEIDRKTALKTLGDTLKAFRT